MDLVQNGELCCNLRCHHILIQYDRLLTVVIIMYEYITAFNKKSSCDYQYQNSGSMDMMK